jgi:hypothetical protein
MNPIRTKQEEVDRNFDFFRKELPQLLPKHRGKFALLRAGPQIEAAPSVSGEAKAKPQVEEAEQKGGLPAVIPITKPLSDERVSRWDDAMTAMNEQHALIENYGNKTVIASWEPSPTNLERRTLVFQGKESFLLRYSNRSVQIELSDGKGGYNLLRMPLGGWWLSHRDRRQYRGVIFRPGAPVVVSDCLNIWQGWGVVAGPGDCGLIRRHIEEVIAGGNAEYADYVVRWIAWSIQNPGTQAEVALVLIGSKGAGKGTLVRALQRIFGAHAFQVTSREEVIGKFNGHLQDCILFVADEAYWGGDKRCVGRLQGMITEPTLPIERKGFDLILVPNYLHVLMLAEPGWVIPAGRYERAARRCNRTLPALAVGVERQRHSRFHARRRLGEGAEVPRRAEQRLDFRTAGRKPSAVGSALWPAALERNAGVGRNAKARAKAIGRRSVKSADEA